MTCNRRAFIKKSVALGGCSMIAAAGLLGSSETNAAWPAETGILQQTLKRLFKDQQIIASDKIDIQIAKIVGSGANVPITVTSTLNNVESIAILVEKNPIALAAKFDLTPTMEAWVSARLKIAESSTVMVIVETDAGFYSAAEKIIISPGNC
ncbi:MAG: thiosulfate oxidation carrier protein SoxY [Methylobacter sp.]|nr:thiosulfate oxidation carrier protein SoxY [Methylobacter sp.]MDP3054127.1 thiosulfate oxidation carrier protein SoxY [Methylobacter sp.]